MTIKSGYVLLIDFDLRVIEDQRNFSKRPETPGDAKTLCQIFAITPQEGCPAETCVNCPVKRSIRTMTPVEVEMRVNGRLQHWHSFPFISKGSIPDKALVHIKDLE